MNTVDSELSVCPNCGNVLTTDVPVYHLSPGVILNNRYTIGMAVGEGGFGITYVGRDNLLDTKIAIKEFYPRNIVTRVNLTSMDVIVVNDASKKEFYNTEKSNYISEAKILAKFAGFPGTVNVIDFFEDNNTAYIVMEFVEGISLTDFLQQYGVISCEQTISLLLPVMKSLVEIHKAGIIHGDISPDNIMITNGQTKLLDFGAARNYISKTHTQTSIKIKHGYAPEEQYREKGDFGPWTDIYALCATIYKCVTGLKPDNACDRMVDDRLVSPSELGIEIDSDIEAAIMMGLGVRQESRFRNMESLIQALQIKNNGIFDNIVSNEHTGFYKPPEYRDVTQPIAETQNRTIVSDYSEKEKSSEQLPDPIRRMPVQSDNRTKKLSKKTKTIIAVLSAFVILIGGISAVFLINGYISKHNVETILIDDSSQKVYVQQATLPDKVIKGNPFKIRGIINANEGVIVDVYGSIETLEGKILQESDHKVKTQTHNLKKSINNYLIFGDLGTGEYIYRVNVTTEKGNTQAVKTIIQCKFKVVQK